MSSEDTDDEGNTSSLTSHTHEKSSMIRKEKKLENEETPNKRMQTFAGVAGNILEWFVHVARLSTLLLRRSLIPIIFAVFIRIISVSKS